MVVRNVGYLWSRTRRENARCVVQAFRAKSYLKVTVAGPSVCFDSLTLVPSSVHCRNDDIRELGPSGFLRVTKEACRRRRCDSAASSDPAQPVGSQPDDNAMTGNTSNLLSFHAANTCLSHHDANSIYVVTM